MTKTAMRLARESLAAGNWKMALEEYAKLEKEGSAKEEAELAVCLCNFAKAIESQEHEAFESWIAKFEENLNSFRENLDPSFTVILTLTAAKALLSPFESQEIVPLKAEGARALGPKEVNAMLSPYHWTAPVSIKVKGPGVQMEVAKLPKSRFPFNVRIALFLRGSLLDYINSPVFSDLDGERQLEILNYCAKLDKSLLNVLGTYEYEPGPILKEPRMKAVYKAFDLADPRIVFTPFYSRVSVWIGIGIAALLIAVLVLWPYYEICLK
ncbi:MAG: hypothetical protein K6G50_06305 [bacterium]|nr:hypothetical protein [bacterium]